jgi:hypothetical protein
MPVFSPASARPRQELAMAIVEGEGSVSGLIYNNVLPDFPINLRTAHLIKMELKNTLGLRHIAADKYIRVPGTKFERAVATFADATIDIDLRGIEIVIPNEVQLDYAGYLNVESFYANRFGREVSGLTKEYLAAAQIFNTTNFGAATNSTVAYTVANTATNSFISDMIAAARRLKAAGEPGPYVAVMSGPVFERVRQSTAVATYVRGTLVGTTEVTLNAIKAALAEFGYSDVLVGDAYYNNAADGAAPSLSQIWSNTYIWVGTPGMANTGGADGLGVPTMGGVGVTAYWEGWAPGGVRSMDKDSQTFPGGNYVETYPDLSIDSMIARLKVSSKPFLGNTRAGTLIATQFS